jgi:hypothetical protein
LTLWRHEELTPLAASLTVQAVRAERDVHGVHRGDPRRERAPLGAQRATAWRVPVDPRGRPAAPWHRTVSLAQNRAVARCWPARRDRDRDRRWPAMPHPWSCRAMPRAAHRAMLHTRPGASGVWRQRRAIVAVVWPGGSAAAGAALVPLGCRLAAGDSGLGARPRSARPRPSVCGLCAASHRTAARGCISVT